MFKWLRRRKEKKPYQRCYICGAKIYNVENPEDGVDRRFYCYDCYRRHGRELFYKGLK